MNWSTLNTSSDQSGLLIDWSFVTIWKRFFSPSHKKNFSTRCFAKLWIIFYSWKNHFDCPFSILTPTTLMCWHLPVKLKRHKKTLIPSAYNGCHIADAKRQMRWWCIRVSKLYIVFKFGKKELKFRLKLSFKYKFNFLNLG